MQSYLHSGLFSDVVLFLPPSTRIPCHRLILSHQSPYWLERLQGDEMDTPVFQLDPSAITPQAAEYVLQYMYRAGGSASVINNDEDDENDDEPRGLSNIPVAIEDIPSVLYLSDTWQIHHLRASLVTGVHELLSQSSQTGINLLQSIRNASSVIQRSQLVREVAHSCVTALELTEESVEFTADYVSFDEMLAILRRYVENKTSTKVSQSNDLVSSKLSGYLLSCDAEVLSTISMNVLTEFTTHITFVPTDHVIPLLTLSMKLRDAALAHRCLLRISEDPQLLQWFHSQPQFTATSELFSQEGGAGQSMPQHQLQSLLTPPVNSSNNTPSSVGGGDVNTTTITPNFRKRERGNDVTAMMYNMQDDSPKLLPDDLEESLAQYMSQRHNSPPDSGTLQDLLHRLNSTMQDQCQKRKKETEEILHGVLKNVQEDVSLLRNRVHTQQLALEETVVAKVAQLRTEITVETNAVEILKNKIHDVQRKTQTELTILHAEVQSRDEAIRNYSSQIEHVLHSAQEDLEHLRTVQNQDLLSLKTSLESYLNAMDSQMEKLNSQYLSPMQSLSKILQKELNGALPNA
eukprot:PhF_6_TR33618/c0_g1_i1/m.49098